ncbi:MAG: hypothetical protein AAFQ37_13500 [Bacteroidota bacterium]
MQEILDKKPEPKKQAGFRELLQATFYLSLLFTFMVEAGIGMLLVWPSTSDPVTIRMLKSFLTAIFYLMPILILYWPLTWFKNWMDKKTT